MVETGSEDRRPPPPDPGAGLRVEALLAAWLAVALVVRATVRDAWPGLAILHYASPLPLLAGLALLLATSAAQHRRRRRALLATALGGALVVASVVTLRGPRTGPAVAGLTWRLATWNAGRPDGVSGARSCWDALAPDLLVVVEPGFARESEWVAAFPGLTVRRLPGSFVVVTRGAVEVAEGWRLGPGSGARHLRVTLDGTTLDVVAIDLHGAPWRHRGPALLELGRHLDALRSRRLVVLGDFNTPHDSALLDDFRRGRLVDALAQAGRGWRGTWPRWVPVLDIDRVLVSPGLAVAEARAGGCDASDHRPVTAVVRRP